jgi:hypothetical protein
MQGASTRLVGSCVGFGYAGVMQIMQFMQGKVQGSGEPDGTRGSGRRGSESGDGGLVHFELLGDPGLGFAFHFDPVVDEVVGGRAQGRRGELEAGEWGR